MAGTWRQELKQGVEGAVSWLAPHTSLLSDSLRTIIPQIALSTVRQAFLPIINQENTPQACLQASLVRSFSQVRPPHPN